ncbi:MAG: LysR family transcriptional regulator [Acetobacteraceae bacterium]
MRHLRPLRYVDEVARAGSIRRAAERLNVTASAVNRRIADLEAELGTALFERLPRGMRPTAAGELLLRHIRERAADLEFVRSQIEDLRGLRRGTVRLAVSQAVAHRFLGGAIAAFRAGAPLVRFAVTVCDHGTALALLAGYEVDLVLVVGPPRTTELLVLATIAQPLVAVLREDHPLAARATLRLSDLEGERLVLPDRSLAGRRLLDAALASRGRAADPAIEGNGFQLLWQIIRAEGGIGVQLALGAPPPGMSEDGLVSRPLDPTEVAPASVVLGQAAGRVLPVAAARFASSVASALDALGR